MCTIAIYLSSFFEQFPSGHKPRQEYFGMKAVEADDHGFVQFYYENAMNCRGKAEIITSPSGLANNRALNWNRPHYNRAQSGAEHIDHNFRLA